MVDYCNKGAYNKGVPMRGGYHPNGDMWGLGEESQS